MPVKRGFPVTLVLLFSPWKLISFQYHYRLADGRWTAETCWANPESQHREPRCLPSPMVFLSRVRVASPGSPSCPQLRRGLGCLSGVESSPGMPNNLFSLRWPQVGNANFSNKCLCQLHAAFLTARCSHPLVEVAVGGLFPWFWFLWFCGKKNSNSSKKCGFQMDHLKKGRSFPSPNDVSVSLQKRERGNSREGTEQRRLNTSAVILSLENATRSLQ